MRIYKTQESVEKDIKNGILDCNFEDVKFECNISIRASIINARDINAYDINARDINAYDINANDINAYDINAHDINAGDINAGDINAHDINAGDINARDINAHDINARDISYYAFLTVYNNIKCKSYKSRRDNHSKPICLDGKLEIIDNEITELTLEQIAEKFGKDVKNIKIKK